MARLPTSTFPIRHTQDKLSRYMRSLYLTNDTFSSLSWRKFKGVDEGKKFPLSVSGNLFWCIMKQLMQSYFINTKSFLLFDSTKTTKSCLWIAWKVCMKNNTIKGAFLLLLTNFSTYKFINRVYHKSQNLVLIVAILKTFPLPHAASITSWSSHKSWWSFFLSLKSS